MPPAAVVDLVFTNLKLLPPSFRPIKESISAAFIFSVLSFIDVFKEELYGGRTETSKLGFLVELEVGDPSNELGELLVVAVEG
jgi:hypothetical protein